MSFHVDVYARLHVRHRLADTMCACMRGFVSISICMRCAVNVV